MIHFVTTQDHQYTVRNLVRWHGKKVCRQWTYEQIFRRGSLPLGTWIFTDHERLSDFELEAAGQIATRIEAAGSPVLNHPARVRGRFETLNRLREQELNDFSAFRCESTPQPSRFPVFVRWAYDHKNIQHNLIENQAALNTELQKLEEQGVPLQGKLVIEYSGEQMLPNTWCRFSTYRIGTDLISHHTAFDHTWVVKNGLSNDAFEEHPDKTRMIDIEREFVSKNLYASTVEKAFTLARIDYGRADFALVNNRIQVYEINTNPTHGFFTTMLEATHPDRRATQRQSEEKLQASILALNHSGDGNVTTGPPLLRRLRSSRAYAGVRALRRP